MKTYVKSMSLAAWLALADHPLQRPTERHAKKVGKSNLSTPFVTHQYVAAAVYGTRTYKVDGHTRSMLWADGQLEAPRRVTVVFYEPLTQAEFDRLYRAHDNREAAEDSKDILGGVLNYHGVDASPMVRDSLTTALQVLEGRIDIMDAVEMWKPEILLASDIVQDKTGRVGASVLAAILATLRKHGAAALPFWNEYRRGMGHKQAKAFDAVQEVADKRGVEMFGRGDPAKRKRDAESILGSAERGITSPGEMFKFVATGLELEPYLAGVRKTVPISRKRRAA